MRRGEAPELGWAHLGLGDPAGAHPTREPEPLAAGTRRQGLCSTWHHAVGGNRTHGNGCQHRLQEETQCQHRAQLPPRSGSGGGSGTGEQGPGAGCGQRWRGLCRQGGWLQQGMQVPGQWALLSHPTHAAGAIWVMIPTPFRFRFRWEAGGFSLLSGAGAPAEQAASTATSTVAPCCILGSPAAGGGQTPPAQRECLG